MIPTAAFGRTAIPVSRIAQGGARMDLHPDIPSAATYVRTVYDLGITYFDCARAYWDGRSEEAYGIGLEGVRKNVFLTSKSLARTAKDAERDLETSLRLLKTDYLDLWQIHAVGSQADIDAILAPGGALEAFEAAKKAGKCRHIGFTGHSSPEAHATLLRAYDGWDSVMMPLHAAEPEENSFAKIALPVAVERGVSVQAIKIFAKAFLLRTLNPVEVLTWVLNLPGVQVAVCGACTQGQMEDNIRTATGLRSMSEDEMADVRRRAVSAPGMTGPLEYWKK